MSATEIIYIDANRQMSKKSDSNNNVWEYKLSDEALVLPAGTQITIQDTFVNKKGAGGQSIEIEEDIDEMVDFGFYVNDSPNWIPLAESTSDPAVEDYEKLYDNCLVPHSSGNTAIKFRRNPQKNYLGWNTTKDAQTFGKAITYFPESVGGSNTPLPCVMMNGSGQLDVEADYAGCDIRPFVKEVNIFIPKGVYGLSELALLITDQMTGKLTNVRNGDFNEDYIMKRLNRPITDMNQDLNENETTYCKRLPLFSTSISDTINFQMPYSFNTGAPPEFTLLGCTDIFEQDVGLIGIPFVENNIHSIDVLGLSAGDISTWIENPGPSSSGIKIININGEYFKFTAFTAPRNDGRYGTQAYSSFRGIERGHCIGLDASNYQGFDHPNALLDASFPKTHPRWQANQAGNQYGPSSVGRLIVNGTKFGRAASGSSRVNDQVKMRFPQQNVGFFTTPDAYSEMMRDIKIPTSREGYAVKTARYKAAVQLQPRNTPPTTTGDGGVGADSRFYNFQQKFFQVDYMDLYRFDDISRRNNFDFTAKNFDYNPVRRGYYVGAPDFQLDWDDTKSSFEFNYLHQPHRIPSHDQYANPIEGDGTECIELKRLAQECRTGSATNGDADFNENYVSPSVAGSLENPQRRLGGIMIYNWARKAAQKYSDIDYTNPDVMNQECVGNGADDYHSANLLTFADYFSSPEKANVAWKKTIWAKLGFSYNQMSNPSTYEKERRYDIIPDIAGDAKSENMRLYGMSTTGDMSVSMNPTISTTYNDNEKAYHDNEIAGNIRIYNNMDINTPYLPFTTNGTITNLQAGRTGGGNLPGSVDNSKSYFGSMYKLMTSTLVTTKGRSVQAQNLPTLNKNGYLIVNSDIIDTHNDSIKNGQNMCMLGIIPLGGLASQDFITATQQMVHIVGQEKVLNSIKINIVNPDLTPADLDENSSVIIKIVRPVAPPPHIVNTRVEAATK